MLEEIFAAAGTSLRTEVEMVRLDPQYRIIFGSGGQIDATPDITLAELRERLITERGETFALSTIHDFYRRHRITFKKRRRTPASKRART